MTGMPAWHRAVARARAWIKGAQRYCAREFDRNPRLHYGMFAVALILGAQLWFAIEDIHGRQQAEMEAASAQLAEFRRLAGAREWRQRRDDIARLRAQMENRLWAAESDGLAQADFQNLLAKLAKASGMPDLDYRIELVANPTNRLKLRQMSASLTGRFDAAALQRFLAALEREGRLMVVDRLRIDTLPVARLDMLVTTYLRPEPGAARRS